MRGRFLRVGVAFAASSLVGVLVSGNGAGAAPATGGDRSKLQATSSFAAASTVTGSKALSSRLAQSDPALLKLTGTAPTSVMVKLDYDPLATYQGDLPGLPATSPQVTGHKLDVASQDALAYSAHISAVDASFVAALRRAVPSAAIGRSYHTVYGGVSVKVPANQVRGLLSLPGAVAVQADTLNKIDQVAPVADDDAEFIGGNAAYSALGSSATAGAGVIVADVDTGVWPEHPSFAARPDLGTAPATPDGHPRACNFGKNPLTGIAFACNNKLIEGQVFLDTYNSILTDELYKHSARDSGGHGTHTTSTAAGNPLDHAPLFGIDRGPVQGIAPGAFVMSYKVFGPQGGFVSDIVAAIEQAVKDGADVINYSAGPPSPQSAYTAPDDLAFLDAFDAGIFVSASAGNSGPAAASTSHLGPWETTVGASSLQRAFSATATITAPGTTALTLQGSTITQGIATATPVVNATVLAHYDAGCSTPAPAGSFTGKIVVCVRGGIGRVQKGFNVKAGGAAGLFLINPVVQDTETDNHFLPAIHFDQPAGASLEAFLAAHPGAKASFPAGQETDGQGDVMASFSSRGPNGDFLKPDIVAPGVQILAGNTPTPSDVASGPPGQLFQAIAGTSMSAPHITGSAALVFALHPGFSPAQVKSALMTTANRNVVNQDGHTPAGVFDQGSGRVDLAGVVDPGLTLDVTRAQMDAVLTDPVHRIDLNEPSIYDPALPGRVTTTRTFKNIDAHPEVYKVTVASDVAGAITVTPQYFNAPPGASVTLTITIDATTATPGTFSSGQIDLTQLGGSHHLHLPVAYQPVAPNSGLVGLTTSCAPAVIHLSANQDSTCTAVVQNHALQPVTVNLNTTWSDNLRLQSATQGGAMTGRDTVTFPAKTLAAAKPPVVHVASGDSPFGYVDLAAPRFGIPLIPMGDDTITNIVNLPPFVYAGASYTSLGVGSNGYLVVGGSNSMSDVRATPQHFPDPAPPNNVLAPFWTDLDGGNGAIAGQGLRFGQLTDGTHHWIVVQWNAHVFDHPETLETFQVWLGFDGVEDLSFAYDPDHLPVNPGIPFNVGAENADGTAGDQIAGLPTSDLVVTDTPGVPGSARFAVTLRPYATLPDKAPSTVETDMTTSINRETTVAKATIQVLP